MSRLIIKVVLAAGLLAICAAVSIILYAYPLINEAIESSQIMSTREHDLSEAEGRFRLIQNELGSLPTQSIILLVIEDRVFIEPDLPHCIHGVVELLYGSLQSYEELIAIFSEEFVGKRGWRHEGFNLGYVDWELDVEPQHQYDSPDFSTSIDIVWWSKEAAVKKVNFKGKYITHYLVRLFYTDLPCNI